MSSPSETVYKGPSIRFTDLKGVDQRQEFGNKDLGFFNSLRGAVPVSEGVMTKINGTKLYQNLGEQILSICQTNDSRKNVIIQTVNKILIQSETEFFASTPYIPTLIPSVLPDVDNAPRATIAHTLALGGTALVYNTSGWQQAPLDATFTSQINPDGTNVTSPFATVASNRVTLAVGVYHITGYSIMTAQTLSNSMFATRLYNVTTAAAAWVGLPNEASIVAVNAVANQSVQMFFGGDLTIGASSIFEIQGMCNQVVNITFGGAKSLVKEHYRWMEIYKLS